MKDRHRSATPKAAKAEHTPQDAADFFTLTQDDLDRIAEFHSGALHLWETVHHMLHVVLICYEMLQECKDSKTGGDHTSGFEEFKGYEIIDGVRVTLRLLFRELRSANEAFDLQQLPPTLENFLLEHCDFKAGVRRPE